MNIFNLKDQFDLTSNLISNRFNIMKCHDVIIENSYMIETISNALPFQGFMDQKNRLEQGPADIKVYWRPVNT